MDKFNAILIVVLLIIGIPALSYLFFDKILIASRKFTRFMEFNFGKKSSSFGEIFDCIFELIIIESIIISWPSFIILTKVNIITRLNIADYFGIIAFWIAICGLCYLILDLFLGKKFKNKQPHKGDITKTS